METVAISTLSVALGAAKIFFPPSRIASKVEFPLNNKNILDPSRLKISMETGLWVVRLTASQFVGGASTD